MKVEVKGPDHFKVNDVLMALYTHFGPAQVTYLPNPSKISFEVQVLINDNDLELSKRTFEALMRMQYEGSQVRYGA